MKHVIIVLSVICFVSLIFFMPFKENLAVHDGSLNDYQYLHDFRRTSHARDDDHPGDGWQKDGTYVPIHMIKEIRPDGSERIIDEDLYYGNHSNRDILTTPNISNKSTTKSNDDKSNNDTNENNKTNDSSQSDKNILPYLLIILALLVIVILVVKYKYNSFV